ncbi:phage holin, LLH family [Natronincola ferrireducens]|uniref:Bacteriophage holin of superfamily 6 (Holin_LLH) n=1 Tax=Natronincola ferrireducens TaxID=393762 RepID=A0A1G9CQH0_9FIRM|nr:phage holin, LLH family [Natronincola ferrireducens]SDK53930.1 Bacteriophage holin of superfamily 6 (Holin_LLH) [Natronincola ferrireducens]
MIDLILFMLIITLTALFIFVVAPIFTKVITKKDIDRIQLIIHRTVLYVEQMLPLGSPQDKKNLALDYSFKIFDFLEIPVDENIVEVFIESEIYLLKLKNNHIEGIDLIPKK